MSAWRDDPLSIAVSAVDYWHAYQEPVSELELRWHVARHPCDGEPYVAGIDFPEGSIP